MSSFMQDFYDGSRSVGRAKANENLKHKIQKLKTGRREKGLHKKWQIEIECWTKSAKIKLNWKSYSERCSTDIKREKSYSKIAS